MAKDKKKSVLINYIRMAYEEFAEKLDYELELRHPKDPKTRAKVKAAANALLDREFGEAEGGVP